jgi:two-component system NtrC family sensor kinase
VLQWSAVLLTMQIVSIRSRREPGAARGAWEDWPESRAGPAGVRGAKGVMKVLIAEDDRVSRRLLQGLLERWGYQVVAASDGAEAWRRFQEDEFPLVISDWMMSEMDGLELIRRIRASEQPGYVYAILLTSLSQKKDVVQGMVAGADDFVTKPFDLEELRVRLQAGERVIRLERTLTEQNRVLRETQAALIQSQNLASVGQLAAGMAHEINNPLALVMNNLAVLRRDAPALLNVLDVYRGAREGLARVEPALAAEVARLEEEIDLDYVRANFGWLLDKSLEGLRRVRDIVHNLRDFARLDEAEFKEADLNAALTSTIEVLRYEIETKEVRLERFFEPLPAVYCCPGKIDQLFLNLLLNSIQACAPQGVVKVQTRVEPDRRGVVIEVRDNGQGIAPDHLPHIFEPFFTTKAVGQGRGLGLSVCYGIVRDHGGVIEVESAPGQGSVFRVRLPLQIRA